MPPCRRTVTTRDVGSDWIESPRARAILAIGRKRRPPRCCAELFGPARVRPLTIITVPSGKLLLCGAGSLACKFLTKSFGLEAGGPACARPAVSNVTISANSSADVEPTLIRRRVSRRAFSELQKKRTFEISLESWVISSFSMIRILSG